MLKLWDKMLLGNNYCRWSVLLLLCFFISFYWPAVFGGEYLYGDDYGVRQRIQTGRLDWFENLFTQMGRPVFGIFNNIIFRSFNTISDYAWVRAFGLLGTLACAFKIRNLGIRFQWPMSYTLCVILITLATPGWAVYVGWTMCAAFPWAGLLALYAGDLLLADGNKRPSVFLTFVAILLSFISVNIYQITASFILIPFLFWLRTSKSFLRRAITATYVYAVMAVTYAGNMFLIRVLKQTLFADANKNLNRDGLVADIGKRIEVLYIKVLPFLVDQWAAFLSRGWIILIEVVLLVGLFLGLITLLRTRDEVKASFVRFLFYLPCLLFVAAPFILLKEDNFPLRMFPVLNGTLCLGYLLLMPLKVRFEILHKITFVLIGGWIFFQMSYGAYVFREGFVYPNVREVKAWKNQLSIQFDARPDMFIYYEPSNENDGFSRLPRIREYGHSSGSYVWVGQNAINTYFDELFPDAPKGKTQNFSFPDTYSVYATDCAISIYGWKVATPNSPPVAPLRKSVKNHHLLGEISDLRMDWRESWMGVFNIAYWPWIQHVDLGWLWLDESRSSSEKLVFQQKGGNQFLLFPDSYPKVYWEQEDRWLEPCEVAELSE